MDNTTKHSAVWDWLAACPLIADLFFNLAQTDAGDTALVPSETVSAEYIDGSSVRLYNVALTRIMPCSYEPNDLTNVVNLVDFEQLAEWVDEQNAAHAFPAFPAGESVLEIRVLPNESGFMVAQDASFCKYQLQFQIEYLKEGKTNG